MKENAVGCVRLKPSVFSICFSMPRICSRVYALSEM